jgi:hypothetical protein
MSTAAAETSLARLTSGCRRGSTEIAHRFNGGDGFGDEDERDGQDDQRQFRADSDPARAATIAATAAAEWTQKLGWCERSWLAEGVAKGAHNP